MIALILADVHVTWAGWDTTGLLLIFGIMGLVVFFLFRDPSVSSGQWRSRTRGLPLSPRSGDSADGLRGGPVRPPITPVSDPGDHRGALRREGNPVEVVLQIPDASAALTGMVLNRSRGGLLLSVAQEVDTGTFLKVLPAHAPEGTDWVAIEVRHCRPRENGWMLGCKFRQEVPWGVLLLFG